MLEWFPIVRFIHIAASIQLAAIFAFRAWILTPAMLTERIEVPPNPGSPRLLGSCWVLTLFSIVIWFLLAAASMDGDASIFDVAPQTYAIVLFQTQFGHLWLCRLGLCLLLGTLFLMDQRLNRTKFICATLIVASLAAAGHAAANSTIFAPVAFAGDVAHLVTSIFWPGALVPFLLYLRSPAIAPDMEIWAEVTRVCQRFSRSSLISVAALAATGVSNAWFALGRVQAMFDTGYGRLLLVKIVVFLTMIGFGAFNLLILKPRLSQLPAAANVSEVPAPVRGLIKSVLCEILLAAAVMLIVGYLGVTPPPAH
jgi:putative copper resistance protein D